MVGVERVEHTAYVASGVAGVLERQIGDEPPDSGPKLYLVPNPEPALAITGNDRVLYGQLTQAGMRVDGLVGRVLEQSGYRQNRNSTRGWYWEDSGARAVTGGYDRLRQLVIEALEDHPIVIDAPKAPPKTALTDGQRRIAEAIGNGNWALSPREQRRYGKPKLNPPPEGKPDAA